MKQRNRNPLMPMAHEQRARSTTTAKNYILGRRARDDSVEAYLSNHKKAKTAVNARNIVVVEDLPKKVDEPGQLDENMQLQPQPKMEPLQSQERKNAIKYVYEHIYGSVEAEMWSEIGLIASIGHRLAIPRGSFASVKNVLLEVVQAKENKEKFDTKKGGIWGKPGEGYEHKCPGTWPFAVRREVNKKLCSIQDLIDFMFKEGDKIYQDTQYAATYMVYHDALSQFWESDAVSYMKMKGYHDRLLRCRGDTNRGTRYFGKVVGDSPELCRGLDAHGFSDHKLSMGFHTSLTSMYDIHNPLQDEE